YQPQGNQFTAVVSIRQKLYGAQTLYASVPLEVTFFKQDRTRAVRRMVMSGSASTFTVTIPFQPVYCALNFDSKISDATSHEWREIKANGNVSLPLAKATLIVSAKGQDSTLVRVVHHFVPPD